MSLRIACNSCNRTFPARSRPGASRCAPCEDAHVPSIPAAAATVVVLETPGEAWDEAATAF